MLRVIASEACVMASTNLRATTSDGMLTQRTRLSPERCGLNREPARARLGLLGIIRGKIH